MMLVAMIDSIICPTDHPIHVSVNLSKQIDFSVVWMGLCGSILMALRDA